MGNSFNQKQTLKVKPVVNYAEVEPDNKRDNAPNKSAQSESLRGLPKDVMQSFSKDVVGGVLDGFMRQLLGQPTVTPEVLNRPVVQADHEALIWKRKFKLAERHRQEERAFFIRKEQEQKQRIMTVRQELKVQVATMSGEMAAWAREVEIATFESPVTPSIYHENFFDKLLSFVKNLRKRVKASRHWLRTLNAKSAKKKGLWGMAQKGNTYNQEILFSGERAVSMGG